MVYTEFSGFDDEGYWEKDHLKTYHKSAYRSRNVTYGSIFSESVDLLRSGILPESLAGSEPDLEKRRAYFGNIFDACLLNTIVFTNSMMFRRDSPPEVGWQNESFPFFEEMEFVLRICRQHNVAFLDIPTYKLRYHPGQISSTATRKESMVAIKTQQYLLRAVKKHAFMDPNYYESHRVMPWKEGKSSIFEGMQGDPITFELQMAYLRKPFNLLALDDLRRHLRNRTPFPPNSCLVTFDDGWKDNFTQAYPVLNRYEAPAVVFLSVGHIGTGKRFWQERIFKALKNIRDVADGDGVLPDGCRDLPTGIKVEDIAGWPQDMFRLRAREYIHSLKDFPLHRIEPIADAIVACAEMNGSSANEGDSFLSWEEVEEMSRGGIDFGSHGMSHEILTHLTGDGVRKEVVESKRIIEEKIRKKVYAFSYPNGNYDPMAQECLEESGYDIAFGTCRGFTAPGDDPMELKRVNLHEDMTREVPMFLSSILGMI